MTSGSAHSPRSQSSHLLVMTSEPVALRLRPPLHKADTTPRATTPGQAPTEVGADIPARSPPYSQGYPAPVVGTFSGVKGRTGYGGGISLHPFPRDRRAFRIPATASQLGASANTDKTASCQKHNRIPEVTTSWRGGSGNAHPLGYHWPESGRRLGNAPRLGSHWEALRGRLVRGFLGNVVRYA